MLGRFGNYASPLEAERRFGAEVEHGLKQPDGSDMRYRAEMCVSLISACVGSCRPAFRFRWVDRSTEGSDSAPIAPGAELHTRSVHRVRGRHRSFLLLSPRSPVPLRVTGSLYGARDGVTMLFPTLGDGPSSPPLPWGNGVIGRAGCWTSPLLRKL